MSYLLHFLPMALSVSVLESPLSWSVPRFRRVFAVELSCSSEGELFRLRIAENDRKRTRCGKDQKGDEIIWSWKRQSSTVSMFRVIKDRWWQWSEASPRYDSVGVLFCPLCLQHFFYIVFTKCDICSEQLINATFSSRLTGQPINDAQLFAHVLWTTNKKKAMFPPPASTDSQSESTCGSHLGKLANC